MQLDGMMVGIITGVTVGVVMIGINQAIAARREKNGKGKKVLEMLLRCDLAILCALKSSGLVNGQCDKALEELNAFLVQR